MYRSCHAFALLFTFSFAASAVAQSPPDASILAEVRAIKAIDDHSHVERLTRAGESDETGDAMPCGSLTYTTPPPVRLRFDNLINIGAWRELYDYKHDDMSDAHVQELLAAKERIKARQGDNYPSWVLDKLGIDVMLANREEMGRGLNNPRFRWVGYGDPLLLPFATDHWRQKNPDVKVFLRREMELKDRFLADLKLKALPATLDGYLKDVVTASLARERGGGAIAIKFLAAYYRPLSFDPADKNDASRIYAKYRLGGEPTAAEYKSFQDYVFRYIVPEVGRLGMAVHIHTGGGCGEFYDLIGGNPILLSSVINDPGRGNTKIVLIHGGYPFYDETAFLLSKPNIYADFSAQTFLLSPHALAKVLQSWLEYEPEKVLFGTDASPGSPEVNWEESAWVTTNNAREALAIALTDMVREKEITRARASRLAQMVMRGNAADLYKLDK